MTKNLDRETRAAVNQMFRNNVRAMNDDAITEAIKSGLTGEIRQMARRESLRRERAAERFISWCMH